MASILENSEKEFYKQQPRQWHEITESQYEWLFECLPPLVYGAYGFVNSEPHGDDKDGNTYYSTCIQRDGKYYARLSTVAEFKATRYLGADNVLPPINAGFYWIPSEYRILTN